MPNHIQIKPKAHKYVAVPCDPEYVGPTPWHGWYISITKHTLGPELLGLTMGWERTLGLELAGAHPEAAESTRTSRCSKESTIEFSSNTIKAGKPKPV
jgi:hypothetical protein